MRRRFGFDAVFTGRMLWKTLAQTKSGLYKKLNCIYYYRLVLIVIAGAWDEVRGLPLNLRLRVNIQFCPGSRKPIAGNLTVPSAGLFSFQGKLLVPGVC